MNILLWRSRLVQIRQYLVAKALVLANPTELEIFWPYLEAKVLVLLNPTELEILQLLLVAKALILLNPT